MLQRSRAPSGVARMRLWLKLVMLSFAWTACSAAARGPSSVSVSGETGGARAPGATRADAHAAEAPALPAASADSEAFTPPGEALALPVEGDRPFYDIEQRVDDRALAVLGSVVISFRNPSAGPLASVPLLIPVNAPVELGIPRGEASSLQISDLRSLGGPATRFRVVRPSVVMVSFERPVAPGTRVQLALRYVAKLARYADDGAASLEQALLAMDPASSKKPVDLRLFGVSPGSLTLSSGYPMLAPYHHGAFDVGPLPLVGDVTYNQVATFRVRTTLPTGFHLVSNLSDERQPGEGGATVTWLSRGSDVRDVAFVASRDFHELTTRVGGVRVTSTFRSGDAAGGQRALATAASSLASFQRRYGQYPWPELHIVEAPLASGVGGMEYCGMAVVATSLYRPPALGEGLLGIIGGALGSAGAQSLGGPAGIEHAMAREMEGALEFTVAHEVAHQYFAGVLGNDSRADACVDEPLAQFAAAQAIEDLRGAAAGEAALDRYGKVNYALYRLTGGADGPAERPSTAFASSLEYAALVYGKAPFAYVALRRQLGAERLNAAIRAALGRYRFAIVDTGEWMEALAQAGPAVLPVLRRYFEGTEGDRDLHVDDSGAFLMATFLPKGAAESLQRMGISPRDLVQLGRSLKGLAGGGLGLDSELPSP